MEVGEGELLQLIYHLHQFAVMVPKKDQKLVMTGIPAILMDAVHHVLLRQLTHAQLLTQPHTHRVTHSQLVLRFVEMDRFTLLKTVMMVTQTMEMDAVPHVRVRQVMFVLLPIQEPLTKETHNQPVLKLVVMVRSRQVRVAMMVIQVTEMVVLRPVKLSLPILAQLPTVQHSLLRTLSQHVL